MGTYPLPVTDTKMTFPRKATIEDVPELLRMGKEFAKAAGYSPDDESIVVTAGQLIDNPYGVIIIGEGCMAGALAYPMFADSSCMIAQELFWWVDEDKRSGGAGASLVKELESWAEEIGANKITLSALASSPAHVAKFYEKHGYRLMEVSYGKELKCQH